MPDCFAALCTLLAYLRAFATRMPVVFRTDEHEMRAGPTNFSANHHNPEVARFDLLAADFEAVVHGCTKTRLVAAQAFVDARLHFGGHIVHGRFSCR